MSVEYNDHGSLGTITSSGTRHDLTATSIWVNADLNVNDHTPAGNHISFVKKGIKIKKVFKLIKGKMSLLEQKRLKVRIAKLEKIADELEKNGQFSFSQRALTAWMATMRECEIYACGFTVFITKELLDKFIKKAGIGGRDILITPVDKFERIIPSHAATKLRKAKDNKLFDEIVVVHYDPDLRSVAPDEKDRIEKDRKDPILFGKIQETDRLYFIADWEDEYCDLTFEDIQDALKLDEEGIVLTKDPKRNLP